jgi:hypothetical protein
MLKRIASLFCIWMQAICLFAPVNSHAQSQRKDFLLTSKTGCKLYHSAFRVISNVELINVASSSRCVNGFYEGAIVYGVRWVIPFSDQTEKKVEGTRVGLMEAGRFTGLRMYYNAATTGGLMKQDAVVYTINKQNKAYSLQAQIESIRHEAANTDLRDSQTHADFLIAVLKVWDQDPEGFFKEYVGSAGIATTTNPAPAQPANPNLSRDDPKVFGRSARGG